MLTFPYPILINFQLSHFNSSCFSLSTFFFVLFTTKLFSNSILYINYHVYEFNLSIFLFGALKLYRKDDWTQNKNFCRVFFLLLFFLSFINFASLFIYFFSLRTTPTRERGYFYNVGKYLSLSVLKIKKKTFRFGREKCVEEKSSLHDNLIHFYWHHSSFFMRFSFFIYVSFLQISLPHRFHSITSCSSITYKSNSLFSQTFFLSILFCFFSWNSFGMNHFTVHPKQ